jgi:membrane protein
MADHVQETVRIFNLFDPLITFTLLIIIFAMVFKVLPRVSISWRDVWIGALVTAILFMVGMKAMGFYFTNFAQLNAFGAAGSLVLILIWVYYSAQIFLFGAEFTKTYANRYGSQIKPNRGAIFRLPVSALPRPTESAPAFAPTTPDTPVVSARSEPNSEQPRLPFGWLLAAAVMLFLGILLGGQRRH